MVRKIEFDLGAPVLFYEYGRRVYGTVYDYTEDDHRLVTVEVTDEDGEVDRYVTLDEDHLRDHDDPDDPE